MLSCSFSLVYKFTCKTSKLKDVSQSVPEGVIHISSISDDIFKMKLQLLSWIMSYWNVRETADPGGITSSMEEQDGKKPFNI